MPGADSLELEPTFVRRDLIVKNANGLHLLPSTVIARTVKEFAGTVKLVRGTQTANAKSPMDVILLQAGCGTELTLEVDGPGAEVMADIVEQLFADEFMTDR
jgi:phosphotransferase system HPr (HPr) family protein